MCVSAGRRLWRVQHLDEAQEEHPPRVAASLVIGVSEAVFACRSSTQDPREKNSSCAVPATFGARRVIIVWHPHPDQSVTHVKSRLKLLELGSEVGAGTGIEQQTNSVGMQVNILCRREC